MVATEARVRRVEKLYMLALIERMLRQVCSDCVLLIDVLCKELLRLMLSDVEIFGFGSGGTYMFLP